MPTKVLIALLIVILGGSVVRHQPAWAEETPSSQTPLAAFLLWPETKNESAETIAEGQKLLAAIRTARAFLQQQVNNQLSNPNYRPPTISSRNAPWEIIVALWNPTRDEFDYTRVLKSGKSLRPITNPAYSFKLVRDNGVNSVIEVVNRPDLKVLGLIHPVLVDVSTPNQTRYRLENVVYIPYSGQINHQVIVQAGEKYLDKKIKAVYEELDLLGIHSLAQPDKTITAVIDPAIVKTILAIEHVDASVLLGSNAAEYLKKFYATLAVNEHASYAYAKSSAAARGLVQFIPATYAGLRRLRPELTLHTDFVQGMTDPYNAIKAAVALLDYNLTLLPATIRNANQENTLALGAYLAAMYNGGPTRVRKAIAAWDETWDKYHGNVSSSLKKETTYYVAKFKLVFEQLQNNSLHLAAQ